MSLDMRSCQVQVNGETYLVSIDLSFERGKLYTVLGRTMSGKTSLLRVIAGLLPLDSGEVTLDGRGYDQPIWKRNLAMVCQEFINYPHLNVLANVAFPLKRSGMEKGRAERRALKVLTNLGLFDYLKRKPSELSGGQQQRVALARALVKQADILLLDEPLVNLDYKLREQLREEFHGIFKEQKNAILIYTTTDPAEAIQLGDRLILLDEGRVIQKGRPVQVYNAPLTIKAAEIINDPPMNIFEGGMQGGDICLMGGFRLPAPGHLRELPDGDYRFGLRPSDIYLNGQLEAAVQLSEISGSQTILHLSSRIGDFVLYEAGVHRYSLGEKLRVRLDEYRLFAFGQDGGLISAPDNPGEARS
ncbi:MAG: ABC transporter ATP-binding protein [Desulfarculaceae bacterium]|jgi:glycerol transport system ATP-binding protein